MDVIKGIQIKVARVAAGMTHKELASRANVAISTLRRIEVEPEILTARVETIDKIIRCLNDAGIRFECDGDKLIWYKDCSLKQDDEG